MKAKERRAFNRMVWSYAVGGSKETAVDLLLIMANDLRNNSLPHEYYTLLGDALEDLAIREPLILFPGTDEIIKKAGTSSEVCTMLAAALEKLAEHAPLVLFREPSTGVTFDSGIAKRLMLVEAVNAIREKKPKRSYEQIFFDVAEAKECSESTVRKAWKERMEISKAEAREAKRALTFMESYEDYLEKNPD